VLTPHAGEFSRLFHTLPSISQVESKLFAGAPGSCRGTGAIVLLKGPDTVVGGRLTVRRRDRAETPHLGSRAPARADVPCGVFVAGLLAQGHARLRGDGGGGFGCTAKLANAAGPGLISEDLPENAAEALPAAVRPQDLKLGSKPPRTSPAMTDSGWSIARHSISHLAGDCRPGGQFSRFCPASTSTFASPERLPAVIEPVEQAEGMAMHMHRTGQDAWRLVSANHHGAAPLHPENAPAAVCNVLADCRINEPLVFEARGSDRAARAADSPAIAGAGARAAGRIGGAPS